MKIHIFNSRFLILFVLLFVISCTETTNRKIKSQDSTQQIAPKKKVKWVRSNRQLGKDSLWSNDWKFVADSVFHGHQQLLKYYFEKYSMDTCTPILDTKINYTSCFDGIKSFGKIKNGKQKDSVFVMRPINYCDYDGQSYYFTDTSLPRLSTISFCCHPECVFPCGDIDEDGVQEIGQYYSSCVSRTKGLWVWTLKKSKWIAVGRVTIWADEFGKIKQRVKKTGKDEFEMLQTEDNFPEGRKLEWKHFKM